MATQTKKAKTTKKTKPKKKTKATKKSPKNTNKKTKTVTKTSKRPHAPKRAKSKLCLDAGIYPKPALSRAAAAFANLAEIDIRQDGSMHVISFSKVEAELADQLPDEFANFALSCLVVSK